MKIFGKKHRARGKSISPEVRAKGQQARADAYLASVWLKALKANPELAKEMAMKKFGLTESVVSGNSDGSYQPDLLETLRTAKEARDLVKDELGEGKGSTIRDIAEIIKVLPGAIEGIKALRSTQEQPPQTIQIVRPSRQPALPQPEPESESVKPPKLEAKMATILELLELEPQLAYDELVNRDEKGWITYLKEHSSEELLDVLQQLTQDPTHGQLITEFLAEKSSWLQELVQIAHKLEKK